VAQAVPAYSTRGSAKRHRKNGKGLCLQHENKRGKDKSKTKDMQKQDGINNTKTTGAARCVPGRLMAWIIGVDYWRRLIASIIGVD
jgi:hypothetical protein